MQCLKEENVRVLKGSESQERHCLQKPVRVPAIKDTENDIFKNFKTRQREIEKRNEKTEYSLNRSKWNFQRLFGRKRSASKTREAAVVPSGLQWSPGEV